MTNKCGFDVATSGVDLEGHRGQLTTFLNHISKE